MGREKLLRKIVLTFSRHILRLHSFYKEVYLGKLMRLGSFLGMLKTYCAK